MTYQTLNTDYSDKNTQKLYIPMIFTRKIDIDLRNEYLFPPSSRYKKFY